MERIDIGEPENTGMYDMVRKVSVIVDMYFVLSS